jgi:hypothetical protein
MSAWRAMKIVIASGVIGIAGAALLYAMLVIVLLRFGSVDVSPVQAKHAATLYTAFGAVLGAIIVAGIVWIIRLLPKRGCCPGSDYDLRGSAGSDRCPECGRRLRG